jgi:hypothetical protein
MAEDFLGNEDSLEAQEFIFHQLIQMEIERNDHREKDSIEDDNSSSSLWPHPPRTYRYKPTESYFRVGSTKPSIIARSRDQNNTIQCSVKLRRKARRQYSWIKPNMCGSGATQSQVHNNNQTHHWKTTICICKQLRKVQFSTSVAMQQIALLWRCFFPRRDVIKWG